MSNAIVHGVINTLVYIATALLFLIPLAWLDWWWIVFFGIIFDVDHVPYFLLHTRPLTIQNLKTSVKEDYAKQVPHFYLCHTIEFELILIIVCALFWNQPWGLWVMLGWSVHLLTDMCIYLLHYKSLAPWAQFWSGIYYLLKQRTTS